MVAPMLDTYREVVTPEGVPLQLPAAGPVPRAMAWLVDLGVRIAVLVVMSIPLALLDSFGSGGMTLATALDVLSTGLTAAGIYFSFTGDAKGWFNSQCV